MIFCWTRLPVQQKIIAFRRLPVKQLNQIKKINGTAKTKFLV
jgi:hypothetical protein